VDYAKWEKDFALNKKKRKKRKKEKKKKRKTLDLQLTHDETLKRRSSKFGKRLWAEQGKQKKN